MKKQSVTNPKGLRKNNKSNILWQLYNEGSLSRLQLAKKCKLTTPSITQLIQELFEENAVLEMGAVQRNATGRKEVLIDINYDHFLSISVNIEADNTHISVISLNNIKEDMIIKTASLNLQKNIDVFAENIKTYITKYPQAISICIGVVGKIDYINGVVENSYGIFPNNFALKTALENEKLELPIYIVNNVIAQALSLKTKSNSDFLYIKHSPGVGCAIVVNGEIVGGYQNRAGELGHTIVQPNGKQCKCGKKGCLETLVSEDALLDDYYQSTKKVIDIQSLYELYKKDNNVTKILDFAIQKLALATSNIVVVINPKKVIVTGGLFLNNSLYNSFLHYFELLGCATKIERIEDKFRIKTVAEGRYILAKKLFEV